MAASKVRLYIAASLDGYIATPDGSVAFLDRFRGNYGLDEFLAQVGTVVLGRTTYDQLKALGQWPYEDKRAYVLTTNEISTSHGNAKRVASAAKLIPFSFPTASFVSPTLSETYTSALRRLRATNIIAKTMETSSDALKPKASPHHNTP